jgi:membrane-associated phospholipid phosphatase
MSTPINDSTTYWFMRACCDGINPALLALVFAAVPAALTGAQGPERAVRLGRAIRFCGAGVFAIAVPVILAELGKTHQVWNGHPGFPSGHTTFAISASMAICLYRGPWWWLLCAPMTATMMVSLVYLRHHNPPEVFGGLVLGGAVAAVIMSILMPRRVAPTPE